MTAPPDTRNHSAIHYWAVVPAAGVGKRMDADIPKQYLSLLGKTVLEHTLERLLCVSMIEQVVVSVSAQDPVWPQLDIAQQPRIQTASGGLERYHSVLNGLDALSGVAKDQDWVLVHDAVRPCVRVSDIYLLIETLESHPVGGVLANTTRDTMKRGDDQDQIAATVDRHGLWHALTPQMFRYGALKNALTDIVAIQRSVTDEAQAMESQGHWGQLVEGQRDNLKITFPEDLALARFYLQQQRKQARRQQMQWL